MQASDVRNLDAALWAVVLSPTRDVTPAGMKLCMECGALKALRPPSRPLGSCLSGTLEAVVFTAPSSPIHLRRVECWRFTKDL